MKMFDTVNDNLDGYDARHGSALTVGTFDGVHRGHAALIETLQREASTRQLQTAVLTFQDMPYHYFRPAESARLLTLPDEKASAFAALGIDNLFLIPFNASIAERTAEEFVRDVLIQKLGMKLLVIGPDFALGKGRTGDVAALRAMGEQFGFETLVLSEKLTDDGAPISSTRIRECVERGDMYAAARLLGRPFEFDGTVIGGQQLGRKIGVPTINLRVHPRKVLPSNGVYAVRAFFVSDTGPEVAMHPAFDGIARPAALNIGTRPTVDGTSLSIEFHVIGEEIPTAPTAVRLQVIERLRAEQKFPGLEELVAQLKHDIEHAAHILSR